MQSILIWMVFPADPSVGLSLKFSSMGWTEWTADLKHRRWVTLKNSWRYTNSFVTHWSLCMFQHLLNNVCFVCSIHLLVQHIKQLVEYILAEEVSCLCWLILGHSGEEWALSPGQTRWRVPESARRQKESTITLMLLLIFQVSNAYFTVGIFEKGKTILIGGFKICNASKHST